MDSVDTWNSHFP